MQTVESVQRKESSAKRDVPVTVPADRKPLLREGPHRDDTMSGIVDLAWATKSRPVAAVRDGLLALARASSEPPLVQVHREHRGSVVLQGHIANAYGADARAASAMTHAWFDRLALGAGVRLRARRSDASDAGGWDLGFDVVLRAPAIAEAPLPVWNAELSAHFAADGALTMLNAAGLQRIAPSQEVRFDAAAARAIVARRLSTRAGIAATHIEDGERLGVWVDRSEAHGEGALAWRFVVSKTAQRGPSSSALFVAAASGAIVGEVPLSFSETVTPTTGTGKNYAGTTVPLQLSYWSERALYALADQSAPGRGRIYTFDAQQRQVNALRDVGLAASSSRDAWDVAAATAHSNARRVLDYFYGTLQRSSWDGRGGDLNVVVHVDQNWPNASFSHDPVPILRFGDGGGGYPILETPRCLDVMAHEVGHGVVATTADLQYEFESGALNESFADVFGAMVDRDDWDIGEDCVTTSFKYLRSMAQPPLKDQPGHMRDYQRLPNTEDGDWGGVHINSGIPNLAAYRVAQAIGREKLELIWYRALQGGYLNTRSGFSQMALATASACGALRASRTTEADCAAVTAAWQSVGVAVTSAGACPASASFRDGVCVCNEGYTPSADGTGCIPTANVECGPNAELIRGECYCRDGYVNIDGACTDDPTACPANSHYDAAERTCVCDEGFEGSPFGRETGCTALQSTCPPSSHPEWRTDPLQNPSDYACVCNKGYQPASGGGCEVVPGSCGGETFYGRCAGSTLVYCDAGKIEIVACGEGGFVCGRLDAQVGMACLNPNGVGAASACDPDDAGECDDANPICVGGADEPARGFCSLECESRFDCPAVFGCCGPLTGGQRACLPDAYCSDLEDERTTCTDVPGGSTVFGRCDDSGILTYCDPSTGTTQTIRCALIDEVCGLESAETGYNCIEPGTEAEPADACPSVNDGTCDVPARCPAGTDQVDCNPCGDVPEGGVCAGDVLRLCDAKLGLVETRCSQATKGASCQTAGGVAACRALSVSAPIPELIDSLLGEEGGCAAAGRSRGDLTWLWVLALLLRRRRPPRRAHSQNL